MPLCAVFVVSWNTLLLPIFEASITEADLAVLTQLGYIPLRPVPVIYWAASSSIAGAVLTRLPYMLLHLKDI
jgi:hypothetical protein